MEIRLVAPLVSPERPSSTREDFWAQLKTREAAPGLTPGQGEKKVFQEFPKLLAKRIDTAIQERRQPFEVRLVRKLRPFRRQPILKEKFTISVVSVGYG